MLTVRDIMTRDVITVSPQLTLREAMELLCARHVSGVPVVEGGHVVGVVSATDLLAFAAALPGVPTQRPDDADDEDWEPPPDWEAEGVAPAAYYTDMWSDAGADVSERFRAAAGPEWDALEEHTVGEAMSVPALAVPPDTTVFAAAELMGRSGVHRLLVQGDDGLLGIVSAMDITRAVAEHKLVTRVFVFDHADAFDARGA
jgi:CBS domain-containing protein